MAGMTFEEALVIIKRGGNVSRAGWNGKGMYLELIRAAEWQIPQSCPSARYENRLPWIGLRTAGGSFIPWSASQTDLLADDWET